MSVLDLFGDEINNSDFKQPENVFEIFNQTFTNTTEPNAETNNKSSNDKISTECKSIHKEAWGTLTRLDHLGTCKTFQLVEDTINIGRGSGCNVLVDCNSRSKFVSRSHMVIRKEQMNEQYRILASDAKSINGFIVGDTRCKSKELIDGDLIIIPSFTVKIGETISFGNGKRRIDFPTEEEWIGQLLMHDKFIVLRFNTSLACTPILKLTTLTTCAISHPSPLSTVPSSTIATPGHSTTTTSTLTRIDKSLLEKTLPKPSPTESLTKINENKRCNQDASPEKSKKTKGCASCLEDELICSMCHNWFIEPRTLECGHTFCRLCLTRHLRECASVKEPHQPTPKCPGCSIVLHSSSVPNKFMETVVEKHIQQTGSDKIIKQREERKSIFQTTVQNDMFILDDMMRDARRKNIRMLDIRTKWNVKDARSFFSGLYRSYFECRRKYLSIVGLTKEYVEKCSNEQLMTAVSNLMIQASYTIPPTFKPGDKILTDYQKTRRKLMQFFLSDDNITGNQ